MTRRRTLMLLAGVALLIALWFVARELEPLRDGGGVASSGAPDGGTGSPEDAWFGEDARRVEEEAVACVIEGAVADENGSAVAGALVTVERAGFGPPFRGRPSVRATSDARGSFRVSVPCGEHRVTATAPGLVSPQPEEVEVTDTATVHLLLGRRGHTLSGRVIDRSGGVVAMAVVQALRFPGGGTYSVATDGEGHYALMLPLASYFVEASAADYAPSRRRVVVNRNRTADFRLEPAGTIHGRVVLSSGEPVVSAQVIGRMGRRWRGHLATARTDGDGAFDLVGLVPGEYDVEAKRGRMRGRYPGHVPVNVASYTPDVVITVRPGLTIRGHVRDDAGAGVGDAAVQWFMGRGRGRSEETRSRADGSFAIAGLESGPGMVFAQHEDFVTGTERLTLADTDLEVELVLTRGARVRGTVADQAGKPVVGAIVSAAGDGDGGRRRGRRMMMTAGARDVSDAEGDFLLEGIGEGTVVVRAAHLEGGLASHTLEDVEAGREYTVRLVMAQGARVTGTVTYVDGEPAAGATVHAFSRALGPMGAAEAEVTEVGAYTLTGLDARAYTLWVLRPEVDSAMPFPSADSPQREVVLEPSQELTGIDFQLARADQAISGLVLDEAGGPVADAEVGADLSDGMLGGFRFRPPSASSTRSGADGTFTIANLVSGAYGVWGELPGFPRATVDEVEAGAANVVITIPPGAVLSGTVLTATGAPAASYRLRTIPVDESVGWSRWRGSDRLTVDNPEGAFEVRGLRAGSYHLVATAPTGEVGELAAVEAVEGEHKSGLRIQLSRGVTLSGTLAGHASGNGVCADLFVVSDGGRKSATCEGGNFEVEGLASGVAMLMARGDPALVSDRFELTLTEGDNEIALRLVEVAALAPGSATPGLVVQPLMGRFVVGATVANISAGDEVVAVDGVAVVGLGIRGVEALLAGPAGSSVTVGLVAVSGEAYSVALPRSD